MQPRPLALHERLAVGPTAVAVAGLLLAGAAPPSCQAVGGRCLRQGRVRDFAAMAIDFEVLGQRAADAHHLAVVATTRPDGSVHASVVSAGPMDDPVSAEPSIAMVVVGNAAKLRYMRRNGRATVVFQAGYRWASVDGPVRIVGPADPDAGLAAAEIPALLRAVFVAAGGTHDDWDEYDRVMAAEGRTAVFVRADRVMGVG